MQAHKLLKRAQGIIKTHQTAVLPVINVQPARPSFVDFRIGCRASVSTTSVAQDTRSETTAASPEAASQTAALQPFHLAFPVNSIEDSKDFYGRRLGCTEGRSAKAWVDYSLFGHQIVCHEVKGYNANSIHNAVDGDPVPVPHFGLALTPQQFHSLADKVRQEGVEFVLEPHLRFKGQPGEQWTMFFKDPSGNALEFKAMTNPENLFAKYFVQ